MATYCNQHWLLCHIRNSFISTDDSGMCETVMLSDDLPKHFLRNYQSSAPKVYSGVQEQAHKQQNRKSMGSNGKGQMRNLETPLNEENFISYPGLDESDDDDMDFSAQSFDIQMYPEVGAHRFRSNTAQKLEKMDIARRKAARTKSVNFDDEIVIPERNDFFQRKELRSSSLDVQDDKVSRFEIKSMAGNIIPAIATTNAMTAGVVVLQTFKVLQEQFAQCTSVYMRLRQNPRQQLLVPEKSLTPPNPKCIVCAADPAIHLRVDTNKLKIVELRDEVLKKTLNMVQPEVTIESKGIVVISADEEETEVNEQKLLSDLHIVDGVMLRSDDYVQQYDLSIIIMHFDAKHDEPLFEVIADEAQLKPKEEVQEATVETQKADAADEDDGPSTSKRARLDGDVVNADDEDEDDCVITEDSDKEEEEDETAKALPTETAVEEMKVDNSETTEISDDESGNSPQEIVDLDSETSSSDCYSEETPSPAVFKRKAAPLVQEEITVLDSDEEEQEAKNAAAVAKTRKGIDEEEDDDDGPTPCKRTRLSNKNNFNSNEVINID